MSAFHAAHTTKRASEQTYGRYSDSRKKGCPTCAGVHPVSCSRCQARSRLCDWLLTDTGWKHEPAKRSSDKRGTSK